MINTITDYTPYLSRSSLARRPSPIRELIPFLKVPGMLSLGGGLPNPNTFPIREMTFTMTDGTQVSLSKQETNQALQYSPSSGLPGLLSWIKGLQKRVHGRDDAHVLLSTGSQDSLCMAIEMLHNPGDTVLVESPTYSGALSFLRPFGVHMLAVPVDANGIVPEKLDAIVRQHKGSRIKSLYTVPTGQNPSGASLSTERKHAIHHLACKHDFMILEDDPYYYLNEAQDTATSFYSIDADVGRVLRFDSFSKVLSSGMRLGFASGPGPLLHQLELHIQATELHTSGISQAVALKLLDTMGYDGWDHHTRSITAFYMQRRDVLVGYLKEHLGELALWTAPSAGMFIWLQIKGVSDTATLVRDLAEHELVLCLPGAVFHPHDKAGPFVRLSYSTASDQEMEEAVKRIAAGIRKAMKS